MSTIFSSRRLFLCLGLALSWQLVASIGKAESITILVGVDDNFADDADSPPATPSDALRTLVEATGPNASVDKVFDDITTLNDNAGHTFTGLPSDIATATLELRMRGIGGGTDGDGILISFADPGDTSYADEIEWSRTLGPKDGITGGLFATSDPGLVFQDRPWMAGDNEPITLDLGNLEDADGAPVNLIPMINAKGFFDVVSGDDSATDFYRLTYTRIPEPGTATLAAFACTLLACRHSMRR